MSFETPPPPQPPYGQGPYGQTPYAPQENHPRAVLALVLGILGLVCFGPIGIAAYIIGNGAVKEIDASGGRLGGRGLAMAGKILGLIAIVLMAVGLLLAIMLFATGSA